MRPYVTMCMAKTWFLSEFCLFFYPLSYQANFSFV